MGGACEALSRAGHDVVWTGSRQVDPGDEEILEYAFKEGRLLVTLDKDFGELAIVRGINHCGIIRLVGISAKQQSVVCLHVLELHGNVLQNGAIVTAEPGRLRMRPGEVNL